MHNEDATGIGSVAPASVVVPVGGGEVMPAKYFRGRPGHGAVVLIADIHGPDQFFEGLAGRLVAAGLSVLVPDYFFRLGPAAGPGLDNAVARRIGLDEAQSVHDVDAAIDWLKVHARTGRVGLLGFCMGGTFALVLASMRTDLVTVAYYGFPRPQESITMPPPRPMDLAGSVSGPVLALWGAEDKGIGLDNITEYALLAARHNPAFQYEILPGLGHAFLRLADIDDPHDGGGATWGRAVRHFRRHLASTADRPADGGQIQPLHQ